LLAPCLKIVGSLRVLKKKEKKKPKPKVLLFSKFAEN
jgi:hypothetical protein